MAKKANLVVPERRLRMSDGSMMLYRADHRAWYTLERHTGQPLMQYMDGVSSSMPLTKLYDIAWALSASGRMREQSSLTFDQYLDLLPSMGDMQGFVSSLMEMLAEAFPSGEATEGNVETAQERIPV